MSEKELEGISEANEGEVSESGLEAGGEGEQDESLETAKVSESAPAATVSDDASESEEEHKLDAKVPSVESVIVAINPAISSSGLDGSIPGSSAALIAVQKAMEVLGDGDVLEGDAKELASDIAIYMGVLLKHIGIGKEV